VKKQFIFLFPGSSVSGNFNQNRDREGYIEDDLTIEFVQDRARTLRNRVSANNENFFSGVGSAAPRTSYYTPSLRRRQRRSPSPPASSRAFTASSRTVLYGNSRLPSALLEMGFAPRHIQRALHALGLTGELSVASVSQLASWMLENPSIESDEAGGSDRRTSPSWLLNASRNARAAAGADATDRNEV